MNTVSKIGYWLAIITVVALLVGSPRTRGIINSVSSGGSNLLGTAARAGK